MFGEGAPTVLTATLLYSLCCDLLNETTGQAETLYKVSGSSHSINIGLKVGSEVTQVCNGAGQQQWQISSTLGR